MTVASAEMLQRVQDRFSDELTDASLEFGQLTCSVAPDQLLGVCLALRDEPQFRFDQMIDLCGVDYIAFGQSDWETSSSATSTGFSRGVRRGEFLDEDLAPPTGGAAADDDGGSSANEPRFAVVIHLLSLAHNCRLRVKVLLSDDPPRLPSVVDVWNSANWFEREAFDLFGILFEGHPDLRRILTDYGFIGHPFRKDFPLSGHVEMRFDPEQHRVIYEPVSIEPRTLVPKVIRHDNRYERIEEESPESAEDAE
jgi:NADH-quinone oxidoreductase subunit C